MGDKGGETASVSVPHAKSVPASTVPPETVFTQDLVARLGHRLAALECRVGGGGKSVLVAVVDEVEQIRPMAERLLKDAFGGGVAAPGLEVLDRATYETIQRLIGQGLLHPVAGGTRLLHGGEAAMETGRAVRERKLGEARKAMEQAERKRRMSDVLKAGGFCVEAVPPLREAVEWALKAIVRLVGEVAAEETAEIPLPVLKTASQDTLPGDAMETVTRFRALASSPEAPGETLAGELLKAGSELVTAAQKALARAALE